MGFGFGFSYSLPRSLLSAAVPVAVPTDYANLLAWHSALDPADMTLNSIDRSDFTTWTVSNSTRNASQEAPPGFTANTGYTLIEDTANATHGITIGSPAATAGDVEFDVYFKALGSGSTRWAIINIGTTTSTLLIDLSTGVCNQGSNCVAYSIADAGSGWWRVRAVFARSSGTDGRIYIQNAAQNSVNTYTGDGASGIRVYVATHRQRRISQINDKSGNNYHMTQGTDASRPFLITHPYLSHKSVVASSVSTKTLTDNAAIASALSGTGKAFTVTWLCRTHSSSASDWLKLTGATASHTILSSTATHTFGMNRTNDATTVTTPTFAAADFTQDRNWHAVSVVCDGYNAELWIDGQKSSTTFGLGSGACTYTALTETVSARQWSERAVYSRALSTTERANLELGMINRAGLPVPSLENPLNVPGVQAWWEVDQGVTLSSASVSADLTTWTTKTNVSVGAGPWHLLTETTDGAPTTHYVSQSATNLTSSAPATVSLRLRKPVGGRDWAWVTVNGVSGSCYVNLTTGAVASVTGCTPVVTVVGTDEVEVTLSYTSVSTEVRIYPANVANANYQGDGRGAIEVSGYAVKQDRVSAWVDRTLAGWTLANATAASQPIYSSGTYDTAGQVNSLPAVGQAANATARSLTLANIVAIWTGSDVPLSMVGLFNKVAGLGAIQEGFLLAGTTARYSLMRLNPPGTFEVRRLDDTSTVITATIGSVANGAATYAEIFNGTQVSLFQNGAQVGTAQALDVGTCTFSTTLTHAFRNLTTRGFILANRELTTAERTAQENGFKRRAGLI